MDLFASSMGYFTFTECGDVVQPVLGLRHDYTYTFLQHDETNWMHPLGFAYFPDGAHKEVDELEPGIYKGTGTDCSSANKCQAPMYYKDDAFLGTDG